MLNFTILILSVSCLYFLHWLVCGCLENKFGSPKHYKEDDFVGDYTSKHKMNPHEVFADICDCDICREKRGTDA